jgi:hypothetical protein
MLPLLAFLPLLSAQRLSKRFTGVLIQSESSLQCLSVPSSQDGSSPSSRPTALGLVHGTSVLARDLFYIFRTARWQCLSPRGKRAVPLSCGIP